MKAEKFEPETARAREAFPYGCEELGRLESVLLHTPGKELKRITPRNYRRWLFDRPPDIPKFIEEHLRYRELLASLGIRVIVLADCLHVQRERAERLPNLTYLHDSAVISGKGAILSHMAGEGRRGEEVVVREALENLGIPIFIEFPERDDAFEGCLLLSPDTMLVAHTERHAAKSISKFVHAAQPAFRDIIVADIPKMRRFMHPDTVFNRIKSNLALAYLPAFRETWLYRSGAAEKIDFTGYLSRRGIEIIPVSESEQQRLACSFVPFESGVMIHYDTALDPATRTLLTRRGVEFCFFHPEALLAGGGSLRCLTLRLRRRPEPV